MKKIKSEKRFSLTSFQTWLKTNYKTNYLKLFIKRWGVVNKSESLLFYWSRSRSRIRSQQKKPEPVKKDQLRNTQTGYTSGWLLLPCHCPTGWREDWGGAPQRPSWGRRWGCWWGWQTWRGVYSRAAGAAPPAGSPPGCSAPTAWGRAEVRWGPGPQLAGSYILIHSRYALA